MVISDVISSARVLIHDTESERYSDALLLRFVNSTLNRMVMLRPDLFIKGENVEGTDDEFLQFIPEGGIRLVEIVDMQEVNKATLDRTNPQWATDWPWTHHPRNYMRHVRNPRAFFVLPRIDRSEGDTVGYVEYVKSPTKYTGTGSTITELADAYFGAVVTGVVALVESANDDHVVSGRAKQRWETFAKLLSDASATRIVTDTEKSGMDDTPGYQNPQRRVI